MVPGRPSWTQDGSKIALSWVKMGSGSELDVILGHLRSKMAVKIDVRAILGRLKAVLGPKGQQKELNNFETIGGDRGP